MDLETSDIIFIAIGVTGYIVGMCIASVLGPLLLVRAKYRGGGLYIIHVYTCTYVYAYIIIIRLYTCTVLFLQVQWLNIMYMSRLIILNDLIHDCLTLYSLHAEFAGSFVKIFAYCILHIRVPPQPENNFMF